MQYTLVGNEDGTSNLTVFVPGEAPRIAHSSHPHFEEILQGTLADDTDVLDLFDLALTASKKFERLSERVAVANGTVYFDGDEIDNSLTEQVVRFISDGVEDWKPLVAFFDNVMQNPNEHSREQLFDWITAQNLTITEDGLMVGYKGVTTDENGEFVSKTSGTAIADGQEITGQIPNKVGTYVEMPRTNVMHNPRADCDAGLHVGSYEYAKSYAPVLLEVHVNPRDVVSVPDSGWKLRTCRYKVVKQIEEEYSVAVLPVPDFIDHEIDAHDDLADEFEIDLAVEPQDSFQAKLMNATAKHVTNQPSVAIGDTFEDTDKRRSGRTFVVESVAGGMATGKSMPRGLTRSIQVARLLSRKYRRV